MMEREEGICEMDVCKFVTKSSDDPASDQCVSVIEKKETAKLRRFAIRAYVAEIRRKDWKICWPFSSLSDNEESKKQADMLPPLHVPEFRWWGCQYCLQSRNASGNAAVSADKICESRNSDVNDTVDLISSELCPLIHDHVKEKVANVMPIVRQDLFTSGNDSNMLVRDGGKTIKEPNFREMKDAQYINGEVTKYAETINPNLDGSELVELGEANCGTSLTDEVMLKCANNGSIDVVQEEKLVSRVSKVTKISEQGEKMTCHQKPELGSLENETVDSIIGHNTSKFHPLESSKNHVNGDTADLLDQLHTDQHGHSSQTLSSRKPQKLCLLTDIIRREVSGASDKTFSSIGITNSDNISMKVAQTKAADKPDGLGLDIHSGSWAAVQENVGKKIGVKRKKREALQAEYQEPLQMRWLRSASEIFQIHKRDQENNCFDHAFATSKSVDDASFPSGFRSQYGKNGNCGKFIQGKKENKMTQFEDRGPYLKPWQDGLCGELEIMSTDVDNKRANVGTLQLSNVGYTKNNLHPSLSFNLAAQESNKKSTFCMKESNVLEDAQATLIPLQEVMQRQGQVRRKKEEHNQVGAKVSPFSSAMDGFAGVRIDSGVPSVKATYGKAVLSELQANLAVVEGDSSAINQNGHSRKTKTGIVPAETAHKRISKRRFDTSVDCCMASERRNEESILQNHKQKFPRVRNGKTTGIKHCEGMPKEDQVMSKEIKVKHSETIDISLRYATNFCSGRGAHSGLKNRKVKVRKAGTSIKQTTISQFQDATSPSFSKDFPFAFSYENSMDIQGHSDAIKDQSTERAGKMSEMECLNDIPIEIVELLAKNRHERRRLEAENAIQSKLCVSETAKNVEDAEKVEYNGVHEDEMSRYLWEKNLEMHKPQSNNAQGGMSAAARIVAVAESIAYSSHLKQTCKSTGSSIKHLEEFHDTEGSFGFLPSPANDSSGNRFAEATGKNFGVHSCRWEGDMPGHGWPSSSLQCLISQPKCQFVSSPTHIGGSHVPLPNIADPFGIECFHNYASMAQRQNQNFHSEIFKKTNAEQPCACTQKKIGKFPNPVGPSDSYTKETPPATQMLKLMDTGMNSRISHNVDKNMELTNQPPQTPRCEELLPLNFRGPMEASKQLQSVCFSKDHGVGKPSDYFPSVPISEAVSFPVQRDKYHGRRTVGQVSQKVVSDGVKSRRRARGKSSLSPMQAADCKLPRSGSGTGDLGKNHESFSINGNSTVAPLKSHLIEASIGNVELDKKVMSVCVVNGNHGTEMCSFNRNPADFSIPEAGNEFTRGGSGLKCRKMIAKRGRPRLRMVKLLELKEPPQN